MAPGMENPALNSLRSRDMHRLTFQGAQRTGRALGVLAGSRAQVRSSPAICHAPCWLHPWAGSKMVRFSKARPVMKIRGRKDLGFL